MSEPTEVDRATAVHILAAMHADSVWLTSSKVAAVDRLATALAAERAKARAPFLRLLERLDKPSGHIGRDREAVAWMAEHLRAAAQEQP